MPPTTHTHTHSPSPYTRSECVSTRKMLYDIEKVRQVEERKFCKPRQTCRVSRLQSLQLPGVERLFAPTRVQCCFSVGALTRKRIPGTVEFQWAHNATLPSCTTFYFVCHAPAVPHITAVFIVYPSTKKGSSGGKKMYIVSPSSCLHVSET